MIWFEAFMDRIRPVEVSQQTEKTVTVNGVRWRREGVAMSFHPTREEAKQKIVSEAKLRVARAEKVLACERKRLADAEAL